VTEVSWSRSGGADCIRMTCVPAGAAVQVRPGTAVAPIGLPPMAGRLVRDRADLCFVPRFAFLDGTAYSISVDGAIAATLVRAPPHRQATTEVAGIRPTAAVVPRNLLRFYVWFSAPMSEGYAAGHVRLAGDSGGTIAGALLPTEHELWDASRRRLTVLLDPARIKRGLPGHRDAGYPLRSGERVRLVVDTGFRDARGLLLRAGAEQRYEVGSEERRHVEPRSWTLSVPPAGTFEPLQIAFGRPLDHGLLARCLAVAGQDGQLIDGTPRIGAGEQSWQLVPSQAWAPGPHQLIVDSVLEDLAGNSVSRVFDRDLASPEDEPRQARPVAVPFRPRGGSAERGRIASSPVGEAS
jgi:hypothetical protein